MEPILSDWPQQLSLLIQTYRDEHTAAPTYGYKSRMTKNNVQSKHQIKMDFLDNLVELGILCDCPETTKKIDALVTKYEKQR